MVYVIILFPCLTSTDFSVPFTERLLPEDDFRAIKNLLKGAEGGFRDEMTGLFNDSMHAVLKLGQHITVDEGPLPTYANDQDRTFSPDKPYPVWLSLPHHLMPAESCAIHRTGRLGHWHAVVPQLGQGYYRSEVHPPFGDACHNAAHAGRGAASRRRYQASCVAFGCAVFKYAARRSDSS
jgi:hypothetical protein